MEYLFDICIDCLSKGIDWLSRLGKSSNMGSYGFYCLLICFGLDGISKTSHWLFKHGIVGVLLLGTLSIWVLGTVRYLEHFHLFYSCAVIDCYPSHLVNMTSL